MEEKQKPKEILELEEVYGIELKEEVNDEVENFNYFKFDENGNITDISLFGNNIEKIIGFDKFKYLRVLSLSLNKIENITNLTNLTILSLSFNNIKKIENLSTLKNLNTLFLSNNQIEDIEEIKKLLDKKLFPKLRYLLIHNNPFEEKLKNIKLEKGNNLETLRNYFKLEDAKKKIKVKTIPKIMLLGNHNCGKSTFLNYFLNENFNKRSESTHILNIQKYKKDDTTKAIFYDFGGQDYYHGIYRQMKL